LPSFNLIMPIDDGKIEELPRLEHVYLTVNELIRCFKGLHLEKGRLPRHPYSPGWL